MEYRDQQIPGINGNIVLYARVSTGKTESDTTENQFQEMKRWCSENGYDVVAEFKDLCSGRSLECRIGLKEAIVYSRATNAKIAVVELSRLSRSVSDTADLMDSNTEFVFTRSGISMSKEMILVSSIFTQMESESISRRVKAGIHNKFETEPGAREEWGQARHRDSTIQLMKETRISKANDFALKNGEYAFMLRQQGAPYQYIADRYNEVEIKTSRGGDNKWSMNTIRSLILRYERLTQEQ